MNLWRSNQLLMAHNCWVDVVFKIIRSKKVFSHDRIWTCTPMWMYLSTAIVHCTAMVMVLYRLSYAAAIKSLEPFQGEPYSFQCCFLAISSSLYCQFLINRNFFFTPKKAPQSTMKALPFVACLPLFPKHGEIICKWRRPCTFDWKLFFSNLELSKVLEWWNQAN